MMTDEELKESEKSWRLSIHFMWWFFIIYGNWKRRIVRGSFGFKVYEFHLFKAKKAIEYR